MGLAGLAPAIAAAVAFGVQYVPVKKYKIYDGTTFQWFMCSGILFVGLSTAILRNDLSHGTPTLVVMGGMLWAMSNFAVLPLVKLLGIGLGFSLYHFQNMIVGYLIGRHGLFGVPRLQPAFEGSLFFCDAGCGLILLSFACMLLVESNEKQEPKEDGDRSQPAPTVHGRGQTSEEKYTTLPEETGDRLLDSGVYAVFALELDDEVEAEANPVEETSAAPVEPEQRQNSRTSKNYILGVLLAIVAGSLAGVQSVPATLYNLEHPAYPSTAVVFPQCLGVWFASTAIYVVYSGIARLRKKTVQHSVIRPAFVSGCIWSAGFLFMIKGINELGFAVGYTLDAVGPILVASVISICWFKEISGRRQLLIYWTAEALQLLGVVLIIVFSKQ